MKGPPAPAGRPRHCDGELEPEADMKKALRQVVAGAMVLVVVAAVIAAAPLDNTLACLGLLLVATGIVTEVRRRRVAAVSFIKD